ncbi:AAA-16 domain-containing protein [Mycena sanguinolenta]|uniref:AAA-16 domain-containing protein n=1 Tax=Mycena sanguinolenta TaxID=230812 RepID=A0A8H6ZA37_9AGAR|nr:AAA-16 domain-containing protein [Mycena sanguinolenta]
MYPYSQIMNNYIGGATPDTLESQPGIDSPQGAREAREGKATAIALAAPEVLGWRHVAHIILTFRGTKTGAGIDILHQTVALAAIHDSVERFPQPKCHPETRVEMLADLRKWALETCGQPNILWLYGPAGAGKSAIVQTLAEQLQHAGRLGGCFFFKRGHATRGNGKTLFATIAYQLALWVPWLRTVISQVVENDPSLVVRSIGTQMKKLICEPCGAHGDRDPLIILIDGLDECEGADVQEEILLSLCDSFNSTHPIPLRFVVASRPEPHIREVFDSPTYFGDYCPFNVEKSFHDVSKYLGEGLSRIHRTRGIMPREMPKDKHQWALETEGHRNIFRLYGYTGAGKSAIMQTLAEQPPNVERVVSCLFGGATRSNGVVLLATILHLPPWLPWLRAAISQVAENDLSLVGQLIWNQMKLISEHDHFLVILVDPLDGCLALGILEFLLLLCDSPFRYSILPWLPFLSTLNPHIREVFDSPMSFGNYRPFNVEQSFHDVRKYLRDEFSRIHRKNRLMARVPSPWPSPDVLEELVANSSGHFIYASTIIKFINDKNYRPTECLTIVQGGGSRGSESAFDALDQLYMTILHSVARQSELIPILCAIANFRLSAGIIEQLFGLEDGDTQLLLRNLHSVLNVPSDDEEAIYSHHASFLDFLNVRTRSQNFHVGSLVHRMHLARSLLELCARKLDRRCVILYRR